MRHTERRRGKGGQTPAAGDQTRAGAGQGAAKCLKAAQHSAAQQDQHGKNWRGNRGLPQGTEIAGSRTPKAPQLQEPAREPETASAGCRKSRRREQPTRPAKHPKAPQRHTFANGNQDASHPAPASERQSALLFARNTEAQSRQSEQGLSLFPSANQQIPLIKCYPS
ncbi:hypothetical protein NDU88_009520 [Pleurodeles waltl]|uniref:Uncharacterized protein n=1 Tax=Pleurodeles waltl TaxID=8319 RepID=A0AAV7QW16_PLEWA|nr:hypothetical protein NDU88_009520 [Pleurodeles waltl]